MKLYLSVVQTSVMELWQYMLRSTSEDAEKVEHETNFNFRVPSHIHQFSIARADSIL